MGKTPDLEADNSGTRAEIIAAASELFKRYGVSRVNLEDIANRAGLSRRTVYRYFSSRQAVIDAATVNSTDEYLLTAAARMAKHESLGERLAELATFTKEIQEPDAIRAPEFLIFMGQSEAMLWKYISFLRPYIEEAIERREVRPDLNVEWAAEWVTRCLFSIWPPFSLVVDMNNFEEVRAFFLAHILAGLC